LLDENIKNIVRIGSRTKSGRIKDFDLEVLCKNRARNKSKSDLIAMLHDELKSIEDKVENMTLKRWMTWDDIREYLNGKEKSFYEKFIHVTENDLPGCGLRTNEGFWYSGIWYWDDHKMKTIFEKWVKGEDIKAIEKQRKETDLSDESRIDYEMVEPESDRPLSILLNDYSIWQMSISERQRLHDYWRTKVLAEKLAKLRNMCEEKRKEMNKIYDMESRQLLLESSVIGVTTNGAAKYQDLIRSISPKIIICEEAGKVLEAHILSALTPSTQHLILIGDHNQLRPHIATNSLGMDSSIGRNYQLDKSLFERLINGDRTGKVETTQLLTQRRMRKGEISDLIRHTFYSDLIDGENTANYPNVRGVQHNVYFIDHRHPEDNSDGDFAIQSHINTYEVKMVVEMVKYFVRNGYTKQEDIAVLTPYLEQMIKIKEALAETFVVVIDERDAQNIIEIEEEQKDKENEGNKKGKDNIDKNTNVTSTKSLNHQVALRTVDNFQGEEANIVIVSLVSNFSKSGEFDSIEFLKSSNRSNMLLSRAREGMYLIGNSELMATQSEDVWAPVINKLKIRNQIGFGMPIVCNKHPDYKNIIIEPEQFKQFSPEGGCNEKCHFRLTCGHACTYKCHSDNPEHIGIKCFQPCLRLQPKCKHPCPKQCFENCGRCNHLVGKVTLPCEHELPNAKCWQNQNKKTLYCEELKTKELLYCEHTVVIQVCNFFHIL
jgi:hypothetical protein